MDKEKDEQPVTHEGDSQPDLKHDSMEFSASTEGEDKLDFDDPGYEEEELSPEELDVIEDDTKSENDEALAAAEADLETDEDRLPEESWEDDLPDTTAETEDPVI